MSYKLKTTGIAANCTMCIAVDPDTNTIKDFASASVTANMTVGANVTISSQLWNGSTRSFFRLGAGTTAADFVAFGATKPSWVNNAPGITRTVVGICEAGGANARLFGKDSSNYISSHNGASGGNTLPFWTGAGHASIVDGGGTALVAGNKAIFGFSSVHSTSCTAYWAMHDAASMSKSVENPPNFTSATTNFDLSYVGRRNDATANNRDKWHLIAIFNAELSEADWNSLRTDWFGTLFEPVSASTAYTITAESTTYSLSGQIVTLTYTPIAASYTLTADSGSYLISGSAAYADYSMAALPGSYSITGQDVGLNYVQVKTVTVTLSSAISQTNLRWAFFDEATVDTITSPVAQGNAESTDGSGQLVLQIPGSSLTSGQIGYLIVTNSDGTLNQTPQPYVASGPVGVD